MKKFWSEFKAFISKGNIIDLAVAVVIGGAFNKIVSSLVNDIIMPLVSLMVGGADVTDWKWVIRKAEYDATGNVLVAETSLKYGIFIQTILDFLIIALTVFIIVKVFRASKKKLEEVGTTIVASTKELTKKQLKALKKKNKTSNIIEENTNEKTETQEPIKSQSSQPEDTSTKEISTPEKTVEQPSETSTKTDNVTATENQQTTSMHDTEMLYVLKEIRDSLKSIQSQDK